MEEEFMEVVNTNHAVMEVSLYVLVILDVHRERVVNQLDVAPVQGVTVSPNNPNSVCFHNKHAKFFLLLYFAIGQTWTFNVQTTIGMRNSSLFRSNDTARR